MTTKHNHTPNFGRHVATCPRCDEIAQGAPVVRGWKSAAKRNELSRIRAIRAHDCKISGCGPVCVAFDY